MSEWLVRVALFMGFLVPVVIDQYSVNYLFVLFAAFMVLQARHFKMPDATLLAAIGIYVLIYLGSLTFDLLGHGDMTLRRSISFAIFMSIFAFSVVDLRDSDVMAFKMALIGMATVMSFHALTIFFLVGGTGYGFELKNVVGSQRYGFVYLLALFVLLHLPVVRRWEAIAKYIAAYIILAGILLTFSRTSVIAFGVAMPLYLLARWLFQSERSLKLVGRHMGIGLAYAAALMVVMLVTFEFYGQLIFARYFAVVDEALVGTPAGSAIAEVLVPGGSESTRLAIWSAIVSHTVSRPVLGSGYLGSWTLEAVETGSAHGQYVDVLLRTGPAGIIIYVFLLSRIFLFLSRKDPGLFWGGVAVLVYGLFHETFKESQGAFILAFLIGMYATQQRQGLVRRASRKQAIQVNPRRR